jgi:hypothetical protein
MKSRSLYTDLGPRRVFERFGGYRRFILRSSLQLAKKRPPCGKAGTMRKQVAQRNIRAIVAMPCGDVARHGIIECQHTAFDLLHHHRRRRNDLRQGSEIENRVVGCGCGGCVEGQSSKCAPPERLARGADLDDGSGEGALNDCTLEDLLCSVETESALRADSASVQEPANAPRPIPVRNSDPFGGLIRLS